METSLTIRTFGTPAIMREGEAVRGFISSKAVALVYYLAATQREHAREALAGLFWSDVSDQQAAKNLRDVLSNLRRLLEPYLLIDRRRVGLDPAAPIEIDCQQFQQLARAGDTASLAAAVALYSGDFLAPFSAGDAPLFEEWAAVERERLRSMLLTTLDYLVSHALAERDYQAGIAHAIRLLALDPLRESAHRQLMLLYAHSGQRAAALAQYERLRQIFDDELGIEPDAETELLYREILDGTPIQPGVSAQHVPRLIQRLPKPLGVFIGREAELGQVSSMLADPGCRLVTITGLGGIGKTRLALEVAHRLWPAAQAGELFANGIAFVSLSSLEPLTLPAGRDPRSAFTPLATAVADGLGFAFAGADPPHEQLASFLREKALLLVLDNCEHLPAAAFVAELLQHAPRLSILATSRSRLRIRGEQALALDGLRFPQRRAPVTLKTLERYDAVQLFRHTAQAANVRLVWSPPEISAAAQICAMVDGLPLGIELAASLTRLLPCSEIAHELSAGHELVHDSPHDLPERHQTLRAVFQHSWKLLGEAERDVLSQLSVFAGGFQRASAEHVAGANLSLLLALIDHSLVRRTAESHRFELPELVRQYAADYLPEPRRAAVQERHASYFLALVAQHGADLRAQHQQRALAELHQEIENIRLAWQYAITHARADMIDPAVHGMFLFYEMRSWFSEGADMFARAARAIEPVSDDPSQLVVWGKLLAYQGWLTYQLGQQAEGQALLARAVALLRETADRDQLVLPLCYLAAANYYAGEYIPAEQYAAEAYALSRALDHKHGLAVSTTVLGQIAYLVGRYDTARAYSTESLDVEQQVGNQWGMAFPLISLGRTAQALGEYADARRSFQEALNIRQLLRDTRGVALCLQYLGDTAAAQAEHEEARWCYQESFALFKEIGNRSGEAATLVKLGRSELASAGTEAAARHFYASLRTAWAIGAVPRVLDALAGIAAITPEATEAHVIAALVFAHPAATQESRDWVAPIAQHTGIGETEASSLPPLEAFVAALLHNSRQLNHVAARI